MTENLTNIETPENQYKYFMTVPVWKLVTLSIITFGLYEIIWFYKYWKVVKEVGKQKISPFWRAVFCGISCFWLFPILEDCLKTHNKQAFPATGFAVLFLILNMISRAPDPFWLLSLLSVIPLSIIQNKINDINKTHYPQAEINNWTIKTTLFVIAYIIIFLGLAFLIALLPVPLED